MSWVLPIAWYNWQIDTNLCELELDEEFHNFGILWSEKYIKFYVDEKKISSRFNFIKNNNIEEIEFLDLFNNVIATFEIEKSSIEIKNYEKNLNSEALQKIINRPIFKNIITNFSNILMCKENSLADSERYNNGLLRKIKNENYVVTYITYNKNSLPVVMNIDFFNINFDLKIINWKIIK